VIGANALPFSEAVDTTAASSEPNEPLTPCQSLSLDRTAWYKFTPASDESITVNAGNPSNTVVAVYTGSSVSNLSQVACHFSFTTFHADAGTSGQTRQISVGISNRHYPETVQVLVLRSVPNEQNALVGELTQQVPVLPTGRTATFNYNYTFSSADAAVGKVTFFAVANISGHKDALPSDNEAISLPTKVIG
jgi:hypothetical protein